MTMTRPWRLIFTAVFSLIVSACGEMREHTVTAVTGEGGTASPVSQKVTHGTTGRITFTPDQGYSVTGASGCDGSLVGNTYTTGTIYAGCTVSATFNRNSYTLTATAGNGGSISPSQQTILHGDPASFTVTPNTGFDIAEVTGCGGSLAGNSYSIANAIESCTVSASFIPEGASLSGTIAAAAAITVDGTVNDRFAVFVDNSSFDNAQYINNLTTLHGFASAEPTDGDPLFENFAQESDPNDFYRAHLQAGQTIQLQVVDFEGLEPEGGFRGDLDLYLYDSDNKLVASSTGSDEFEQLVVAVSGDYVIEVHAFSGISKYVLRLVPPLSEASQAPAASGFVADEVIISFRPQPGPGAQSGDPRQRVNQALSQSRGQQLQFRHRDSSRPTLGRLEQAPQAAHVAPRGPMAELKQRNPQSYARVNTLRAIKQLRRHPDVLHAEPNYLLDTQLTPNDTYYSWQWHYQAIQLPQAWSITTGSRPAGEEVIVAVIDTGALLSHPDLAGQLVDGYDFIQDPERARDGDGIDNNPDDPGDSPERGQSSWHGTHVAGTIAAATDNNRGVAGASWGARIMPLRALGKNGGTTYDVMQSLRYAAGLDNDRDTLPPRRAEIVNLSLGRAGEASTQEEALYNQVRELGILLVAAAGNNNSSSPMYPAAYPAVLSVSATDATNQKAVYANFGGTISLAAPGGDISTDQNGDGQPDGIVSTLVDDRTGTRQPVYGHYMGTSMAAPHVSGVLALMKAIYPELTPNQVDQLLASGELTDDLGDPGRDDLYGHGLINAFKAVQAARNLAEGGDPGDWPPLLVASPSLLSLGQLSSAQVTISNQGGGDPTITSATSEDDWLLVAPAEVNEQGLGSYSVTVDRTDLNDGVYQGRVQFSADDASELTIIVYMQVGEVDTQGELTQLYVLLLDRETREPRYQKVVETTDSGELRYRFDLVENGEYWVIAGSDIDVDNFICQSGESCGAYPSLNSQQLIEVNGAPVEGVDFIADILGNFSSLATQSANGSRSEGIPRKRTQAAEVLRRVAQ
jgi:serine protease